MDYIIYSNECERDRDLAYLQYIGVPAEKGWDIAYGNGAKEYGLRSDVDLRSIKRFSSNRFKCFYGIYYCDT